ncbi:hypothetical protein WJX74_005614 [Apatococcus lobatus]|uniref:Helicase ATP-binding domain-containing protein n=1 Tax=Apatococcus lobatus TaxID=904363 RepID=A0AAW1QLU2_9CHLO
MPAGQDFPAFPYAPYGVQQDFMQSLYSCLQEGGIGLFESPTGTGKTLSLLCSVLQWLQDANNAAAADVPQGDLMPANEAEPDWMRQQATEHVQQANACRAAKQILLDMTQKRAESHFGRRHRPSAKSPHQGAVDSGDVCGDPDDENFLLDDAGGQASMRSLLNNSDASSSDSDTAQESVPPSRKRIQVFFCSRTHSQLSQVMAEVGRTPFKESLSFVPLGSRKALCINAGVQKLGTVARMNERCLELQKPKAKKRDSTGDRKQTSKSSPGCPYLKASSKRAQQLKEEMLKEVLDVEDLAARGQQHRSCPYYATRHALPEADVVLLPYSSLTTQASREAVGINLQGAVVIVDEAHNLVDAVGSAHSAQVSLSQLQASEAQLAAYLTHFRQRLSPSNTQQLNILVLVVTLLAKVLLKPAAAQQSRLDSTAAASSTCSIQLLNHFLFEHGLDNINMFRIVRFMKESKLLFKVSGHYEHQLTKAARCPAPFSTQTPQVCIPAIDEEGSGLSALHATVAFIGALTDDAADGRILIDLQQGTLKYLLLNPAAHFAQVVEETHALVLASGTLSPLPLLQRQLFPHHPLSRLHTFTCGHVVPASRLLLLPLPCGPTGLGLDLRHATRSRPGMMDELGRLLMNICQAVPQGVVAFAPSFAYIAQLHQHWQASGLWDRLSAKKVTFVEPRTAAAVATCLQEYSAAALATAAPPASGWAGQSGALLLCVVGGRLSEGINFGDGLGRAVVMLGLPFPNPMDIELKEHMRYLDGLSATPATSSEAQVSARSQQTAGQQYYEELCMKAVNQCIGRVIRHQNDWAAVLLADARWSQSVDSHGRGSSSLLNQLPAWMLPHLADFGPLPPLGCPLLVRPARDARREAAILFNSPTQTYLDVPARFCRDMALTRGLSVQNKTSSPAKDSAKSSVETGLKLFSDGKFRDALQYFESAMQAGPSDDEARAALYNSACAHAKLKQWQPATDAVRKAVNDYQLRLTVAIKDADLEQLRETREWLDALDTMRGGLSSRSVAGLRAEAKAPFRLARILTFQGLFAGAAIGLVISSTRLFAALTGQAGAPDTIETARNFGINLVGAVLLAFLLRRDLTSQSKDRRTVEREEAFARLQVSIGDRVLP